MKFLVVAAVLVAISVCTEARSKPEREKKKETRDDIDDYPEYYYGYYENSNYDPDDYYLGYHYDSDYFPEYYPDYYPEFYPEYEPDDCDDYGNCDTSSSSSYENSAESEETPMFAVIQYTGETTHQAQILCYGTVIGNEWALTTASCTEQAVPTKMAIKVGKGKRKQVIPVLKKVVHPKYEKSTGKNNLVLLKLAHPIRRKLKKRPSKQTAVSKNLDTGIIAARIKTKGHPRTVILNATVPHSCENLHNDKSQFCVKVLGNSHIKSCQEESVGTPFIVKNKIRGIYSKGDACKSGAVFTDLKAYRAFIAKVTGAKRRPKKKSL